MAKKSSVFLRGLLKKMPVEWRNAVMRDRVEIPASIPEGVTFHIATQKEELEQAFRILHDAYVSVGLMNPNPHQMRISVYHALPTSLILVAKKGDEVLGTVTIIRDSAIGLPSDKILNLDQFRKPGTQIAEISALAIKSSWRGQLFFALLKYCYQISHDWLSIDIFVASVHSDWYFFYEGLLSFKRIEDRSIDNYAFANNQPVVGEYLDLNEAHFEFAKHYAHLPENKNLFAYFCKKICPEFIWPDARFKSILNPAVTIETLDYFFNQKSNVFRNLSESEYWTLFNIYKDIGISDILPLKTNEEFRSYHKQREFVRLPACLKAIAYSATVSNCSLLITEVSRHGFKAVIKDRFSETELITGARIQIGEFDVVEVKLRFCWQKLNLVGFVITEASESWQKYLKFCESSLGAAYKRVA